MSSGRLYRALFLHMMKVWVLLLLVIVPLAYLGDFIPSWLLKVLFFAFGLFVFLPAVFGIGPIGRRVGRQLNDAAVADARVEREAHRPNISVQTEEGQSKP